MAKRSSATDAVTGAGGPGAHASGRQGVDWIQSVWVVAAAYLALTLLLTWPLLPGLARDIPSDLGDSLLNCWILHWDADHLLRFLSGDFRALSGFWHGNIFYPSPFALAYSEHLVVQAIEILPVYALTRNLVLCYNLLFLSTFVLSALGVYLLVRSLTGHGWAAFLAGLLFAFAPSRIAQFPHLQVLSMQWMAFALFGLHRFFETGRTRALAGASAALVAQNLSCGYFMVFFSPFAAAYAAWEAVRRRRASDWPLLAKLGTAAAGVALVTWPFVSPYLALRRLGFNRRSLDEITAFSANVLAYLTGTEWLRGWGRRIQAFPAPEGELFPGLVLSVLSLAGAAIAVRAAWRDAPSATRARWRTALSMVLGSWAAVQVALVLYLLGGGSRTLDIGPFLIRMKHFQRPALLACVSVALFAAATPRVRRAASRLFDGWGFWIAAAALASVLSLGPTIRTGLREVSAGPYLLLYRYVPGFDGLRVPARFGFVVLLMLSVLAGLALARITRGRRWAGALAAALAVVFVTEVLPAPILVNGTVGTVSLRPPDRIRQGEEVPAVYRYLRALPSREPIVEFPFADDSHEVQDVVLHHRARAPDRERLQRRVPAAIPGAAPGVRPRPRLESTLGDTARFKREAPGPARGGLPYAVRRSAREAVADRAGRTAGGSVRAGHGLQTAAEMRR